MSAASDSTALALMEGVVTSMYLAKLKVAAAILLTLGLVGAGSSMLAKSGDPRVQTTPTAPQVAAGQNPTAKADAGAREVGPQPGASGNRRDLELRDTLARVTKYEGNDDPKMTLRDTLDQLSAKYGISFHVNERAFAFEMVDQVLTKEIFQSRPMPPTVAPLATVLNRILDRITVNSGAVFLIRKDAVEITTGHAAQTEIEDKPGGKSVFPLVYEHFRETPLPDALRAVADHADVNIVIDPKCLAVINDAKVSAPLHNVPVETAVRVLAQMGDLDVIRTANVYYVTSKGDAETLRKLWLRVPNAAN
jgi:hypothetical protein